MPERIPLSGTWKFFVHDTPQGTVEVPSTYRCVGGASLRRDFDLPGDLDGSPVLLHFEGIVMTASLEVNGRALGRYGPYTPFTVDITDAVKPGKNHLRVDLTDLDGFAPWGRNWVTAFPRFGGICRDVYVEIKPPVYIENARLTYRLNEDLTRADCKLDLWVVNRQDQTEKLEISGALLREGQSKIFQGMVEAPRGSSHHQLDLTVTGLHLWSPETPNLYDLSLRLMRDSRPLDEFTAITGFREFKKQGRDFYLNGRKTFLKGIFRHDIYGEQGHTLTRAQMEAEMRDIKSLGCNYVRLGHYPHHPYIVQLAARYGLLVSGEPPVFGMSQRDPAVLDAARFCLGGLIRRDWNNPAVGIWFISNEAGTDPDYMNQLVGFVKQLDPTRLVSIVDNTRWTAENVPWQQFRKAGIDFIAQNAYGAGLDGYYEKIARLLPDDMPYMVSEWGGPTTYAWLLREGRVYLNNSSLSRNEGPRIAGISFWEYQDIPMQRWEPHGLLHWSLVDQWRRPYEAYYALKTLYTGQHHLPPRGRTLSEPAREHLPRPLAPSEKHPGYEPVDLSPVLNSKEVIARLKSISPLAWPEEVPVGKMAVSGLPFLLAPQVLVLSRHSPTARIPVARAVGELEFLGHVCFNSVAAQPPAAPPELPFLTEGFPQIENPPPFKGYPQAGDFGELVAEYVIHYESGEREMIPLKNGIHFADYRLFYGLSPIDARALATERAITYLGDHGCKTYQMRLFSYRPLKPSLKIAAIEFNLKNPDYVPILAAVTVQSFDPLYLAVPADGK